MSQEYSRRDFLTGVLVCGTLTAAGTYFLPGGKSLPHIELNLVTGTDPTGARKLLIDMWNRANPNTTVKLDSRGGPTADQRSQMLTEAKNGTADIVNLDIIDIQYFASEDLISPIDLRGQEDLFLNQVLAPNRVDAAPGQYWAVPINTDVGMLFERRADGEPEADKFLKDALAYQAPDAPETAAPQQFVGQLRPSSSAAHEAFVINILEHALAQDETILDQDGIPAYDPERWKAALTPLREAVAANRISRVSSEDDTVDAFIREPKPRFMRNWPVHYRVMQQKGDTDVRAGRIRVHRLPIGILGGQSLALARRSRHPEQALEVIQFLTSDDAQKVLAAHGFVPTRTAAYNDPNLKAFIPHLDSIRGAVEQARPRPVHRNYSRFPQVVVDHVAPFLDSNVMDWPKFIADMQIALG